MAGHFLRGDVDEVSLDEGVVGDRMGEAMDAPFHGEWCDHQHDQDGHHEQAPPAIAPDALAKPLGQSGPPRGLRIVLAHVEQRLRRDFGSVALALRVKPEECPTGDFLLPGSPRRFTSPPGKWMRNAPGAPLVLRIEFRCGVLTFDVTNRTLFRCFIRNPFPAHAQRHTAPQPYFRFPRYVSTSDVTNQFLFQPTFVSSRNAPSLVQAARLQHHERHPLALRASAVSSWQVSQFLIERWCRKVRVARWVPAPAGLAPAER